MAIVGSVQLLVFGFDSQGPLPPDVVVGLEQLRSRGVLRLLDILFVSRDDRGILRVEQNGGGLGVSSTPSGSTLWQLLQGDNVESLSAASLELHSSAEVGLDLDAVETLAYRIAPGTSALLMLVEPRWAMELLEVVLTSGGFPVVFGCLEPETMLVVGAELASAAEVGGTAELAAAARGEAMLDALATESDARSTMAADTIRALVVARVIDDTDIDVAVSALVDAGFVRRSSVARAVERADAAVAKVARIRNRRDPR